MLVLKLDDKGCDKQGGRMRMLARKLLVVSTLLLASTWSVASLPLLPPPIPPAIRLTIYVSVKEPGVNVSALFAVYRALEGAATQAKLTCHPSMKVYETWRTNGFEPTGRDMVCSDSHSVLIGGAWVIVAPETITIDIRLSSKEKATRFRVDRFVAELEESLKADPSVMTVMQDTWSPEHSWLNVK
jgi:hypothetical protein